MFSVFPYSHPNYHTSILCAWVEICNFWETKQSLKWISMYFVAYISIYIPVHHPDKMFHPLFFSGENLCNVTKKNDETTLTKLSEYIWHGTRSNWFYSSGVRWCGAVVRDYLTPARQFRAHQNRGGWSLCSQSASWLFFFGGNSCMSALLRPSAYMRQETSHHWFRQWLVAWPTPSHYLNQWWNILYWTPRNKLQWNFNRNSYIFIPENQFENVVCIMAVILSRPQCVKEN